MGGVIVFEHTWCEIMAYYHTRVPGNKPNEITFAGASHAHQSNDDFGWAREPWHWWQSLNSPNVDLTKIKLCGYIIVWKLTIVALNRSHVESTSHVMLSWSLITSSACIYIYAGVTKTCHTSSSYHTSGSLFCKFHSYPKVPDRQLNAGHANDDCRNSEMGLWTVRFTINTLRKTELELKKWRMRFGCSLGCAQKMDQLEADAGGLRVVVTVLACCLQRTSGWLQETLTISAMQGNVWYGHWHRGIC